MIKNCNDGSDREPYLRSDFNYALFRDYPADHSGPQGDDRQKHEAIKAAGFEGIQNGGPELCKEVGLGLCASGRYNKPEELEPIVEDKLKKYPFDCITFHVGWGMEDDKECDALVEEMLKVSEKYDIPLYLETHRATITQDTWRTVQLIKRYPDIRLNGDFSHYYSGAEMRYGDFDSKMAFLEPVFERTRFLQGRIGKPGILQANIGDGTNCFFADDHVEMWTRSMVGFLKSAGPGDFISFNSELLPTPNYAVMIKNEKGEEVEECDRWQQGLVYAELAKKAFEEAKKRVAQSG